MKKSIVLMLAAAVFSAALTGCGGASEAPAGAADGSTAESQSETVAAEERQETQEAEEDEENYETGDASLDDPRNQSEGIGEKELLVVSFGTSYNDSRRLTIGAIEKALEDAYPDWAVRRAFTSQIIIDHVKDRDGVTIDDVDEALARAEQCGVKQLVIQPTHLMNGYEYNDLLDLVAAYSDAFDSVSVGEPLLTSDDDFSAVAEAVHEATKSYDDGKTAICFMGHGTEADSNSVYAKMQTVFDEKGYDNYYIGTVEAEPSVDDVLKAIDGKGYERVVLRPLMVVAGDHANNDMAGDEDDSWKSIFEKAGYTVEPVVEGLGQLDDIQKIYVEHAKKAIEQ